MNRTATILMSIAVVVIAPAVSAQDDESKVILPLEAQTCNLPSAPARIPENPTYEDLVKAKDNVTDFQGALANYRKCLDASKASADLTDGNRVALNQAHNYSVEMEERVAEQFNEAVRAYKEKQAGGEGEEG